MDENLPRKASHRIPSNPEPVARVSNPSSTPGQNGVFSDGFLTMTPVDPCHSGQPGETTDPKNPMKSTIDQPSKGSPPSPHAGPSQQAVLILSGSRWRHGEDARSSVRRVSTAGAKTFWIADCGWRIADLASHSGVLPPRCQVPQDEAKLWVINLLSKLFEIR